MQVADELAPSVGWESQGFKAILYQEWKLDVCKRWRD